ncbi:MAG: class II aldolase/adducin family protein [Chloroflexi bacterium]|nr:class II aldolase/adducin family protein [Chloroflexota bacterium]
MDDAEIKTKLATSARILNRLGLFDIYGHVSARIPGQERFYITATLGSTDKEFTPEGLILCDYAGRKISGNGTAPLEVVLHSALHRAREDAGSVAHVHPFHSLALGVAGVPYAPVILHVAPLGFKLPVYKRRELLITEDHGQKVVRTMAKARAMLLRGHGVITLGESIEEMTYHTVLLEENCKLLLEARKVGKPIPLSRAEVADFLRMRLPEAMSPKNQRYLRVFDLLDKKTR